MAKPSAPAFPAVWKLPLDFYNFNAAYVVLLFYDTRAYHNFNVRVPWELPVPAEEST